MSNESLTLEQRTEWMNDFNDAHYLGRATLQSLRELITALYEVGSDRLADRLGQHADNFSEALTVMNNSVSRSISEDFEESQRQIGETFRALLEVAGKPRAAEHDNES